MNRLNARTLLVLSCALLWGGCSATPPPRELPAAQPPSLETPLLEPGEGDVVLAAAGDIADCESMGGAYIATAKATATLLRKSPEATVITPGDLAYQNGTQQEFAECYHGKTEWGKLKERTRPAPGNHDYGIYGGSNNLDAYFKYFGASAGPNGKGFYSFDLGAWHIVSLNSMADRVSSAPSMAEQLRWLEDDLSRTEKRCILAFWHHPLFSSGPHGHSDRDPGKKTEPLWQALYKHGADVIVTGHDHHYERFARQTPKGKADENGILQFVVGTGGAELRRIRGAKPNSEKVLDQNLRDHGALFLILGSAGYHWRFIRTDGSIGDQSTERQACH